MLVPLAAQAQSFSDYEAQYIEELKLKLPDFRVVKKMEPFPVRYNASVELAIRAASPTGSKTGRALVTLHDGVTGEPLESCYTPCTLHKSPGHSVFAFPYKAGHFTFPNEIEMDPDDMREKYPFWDDDYEVKLGPDFRKAHVRGKMCEIESAKMGREDRDAKPCYRMPPPVPQGNYSGYCKVIFDVTPEGKTANVRMQECTDKKFEITSRVAIHGWTYHPKIERGMAVTRPDVKIRLRYDVTDFDGTLLDQNGNRIEE